MYQITHIYSITAHLRTERSMHERKLETLPCHRRVPLINQFSSEMRQYQMIMKWWDKLGTALSTLETDISRLQGASKELLISRATNLKNDWIGAGGRYKKWEAAVHN